MSEMPEVKKKYRLALALGGGGARGLAHIGVLKVLEREKVDIDLIVGTSMGAVVGAMYVQYRNAEVIQSKILSFLDDFIEKKQWLKVLSNKQKGSKHSLFTELSYYIQRRYLEIKTLTRASLEDKDALYEPLKNILIDNDIEDNQVSFAAVSLDLLKGVPVVLDKGSIIDAVYASSAVEGIFPPLEYNGGLLADGGPVNITPVEVAIKLGAEKVIAVDVPHGFHRMEKFNNGLEIMMRADSIGLRRLREIELSLANIVIIPNVSAIHWANFTKASQCIWRGELATQEMMPQIRTALAKKGWLVKVKDRLKQFFNNRNSKEKNLYITR
jgi:NTE family protein